MSSGSRIVDVGQFHPDPFDPDTDAHLVSSTFVGGNDASAPAALEYVFGVYVDHGRVYASGVTPANDLMTQNALPGQDAATIAAATAPPSTTLPSHHAFALRLQEDFRDVDFCTYLTGSMTTTAAIPTRLEWSYGIHPISTERFVVTGQTNHVDFPILCNTSADYCQPTYLGGALDGFVSVLEFDGGTTSLVYSTYLGGAAVDFVFNSLFDTDQKNLYVAGLTDTQSLVVGPPAIGGVYQGTHGSPGLNDCFLQVFDFGDPQFRRSDANNDGLVNIADAVRILSFLFGSSTVPVACRDAFDANDDGGIDIGDAVSVLGLLFASGILPAPGLTCGDDPTVDHLDCALSACP
ncbi:MAG: dockerin type I repeat-containing protein [Planctomycetota bacterium]